MTRTRSTPCGNWVSPITAELAAAGNLRLTQPRTHAGWCYWIESRPTEQGRCVIMRGRPGDAPLSLLPAPFSARSRVHEYGGGAFAVCGDTLAFINDADQQIYLLRDGVPRCLSNTPGARFGDLCFDSPRARLLCVREQHSLEQHEPVNSLVAVALADGIITTLASDCDFCSSPALDRGAQHLAWLQWNHPHMPWDGCELLCAELTDTGNVKTVMKIAGGTDESVFQPQFAPDGTLHFISDRNAWWNIYKATSAGSVAVTAEAAEYGLAQWNLGMSRYGFRRDGTLLAVRDAAGESQLVEIRKGVQRVLAVPLTQIEHLYVADDAVTLLGASPQQATSVYTGVAPLNTLRCASDRHLAANCISVARAIRFPAANGETVHAWYYAPRNPGYRVPDGERPPLIVKCHGGPTAMNGNGLEARIQYWTSRGFAMVDVNYRGSSGYGRTYRRSLHGAWGIKDVEDCIAAARWLADQGLADPARSAISGSSAGGFTVLSALAFHDYFRAGAVYYGISELASAMTDTHKFEARYGDNLLGPWPEAAEIWRARSPLYAAGNIHCPVIFFQGLRDRVVPPDQTERMVTALCERGQTVRYVTFPEEGHGFRRADSLRRALDEELAFYAKVFGFAPHDAESAPPT